MLAPLIIVNSGLAGFAVSQHLLRVQRHSHHWLCLCQLGGNIGIGDFEEALHRRKDRVQSRYAEQFHPGVQRQITVRHLRELCPVRLLSKRPMAFSW